LPVRVPLSVVVCWMTLTVTSQQSVLQEEELMKKVTANKQQAYTKAIDVIAA